MPKPAKYIILLIAIAAVAAVTVLLITFRKPGIRAEDILAGYQEQAEYGALEILYPFDETLFPPEIVSPTFRWQDEKSKANAWLVTVRFRGVGRKLNFVTRRPQWTPKAEDWETIKKQSLEEPATVSILGVRRSAPAKILSAGEISIQTSKDEVGASLFYREVDLPFVNAVKDPSHIRWRFGAVSSPKPPVILQNLPVCGNCHSFTADAGTIAMDVDYANSKGSYVITRVAEQMVLASSDIITWNDYRKEDGEQTFGLLSQISPDGRYVVSTVKDKSVFVPMPPLAFSQLFFPIKGILCVYDTVTRRFSALPGADDPNYVQSNASWSPDGKYIVFARSRAHDLRETKGKGKVLLTREECKEFTRDGKPFLFDLYRIPFNDGKGGAPEPIQGASNNGVSNYFARYSPDGKWIVFCKARSYMLLQPDSELYIIPAEGGRPRKLRCNTSRMNSWHSWSPNGKWLVFSSKEFSPYTQLFLTHIDEQGHSTPAVLLEHFTASDRAANIPEFVNTKATTIKKIREEFLNDYSFVRAGNEFFRHGETDNAISEYKEALKLNPNNAEAHLKMGFLLYNAKSEYEQGMAHLSKAVRLAPKNPRARHDLAMALLHQKKFDQAIGHLSEAIRRMPEGLDKQYKAVNMHHNLGLALFYNRQFEESTTHLYRALGLDPNNAKIHYDLAKSLAAQGKTAQSLGYLRKAVSLKPEIDRAPELHEFMAAGYAKAGQLRQAVLSEERALSLARAAGNQALAQRIQQRLDAYREEYLAQQIRQGLGPR